MHYRTLQTVYVQEIRTLFIKVTVKISATVICFNIVVFFEYLLFSHYKFARRPIIVFFNTITYMMSFIKSNAVINVTYCEIISSSGYLYLAMSKHGFEFVLEGKHTPTNFPL